MFNVLRKNLPAMFDKVFVQYLSEGDVEDRMAEMSKRSWRVCS